MTHIDFHPLQSYVAVCCGPRVQCFDGTYPNSDPMRTFSKFKGASYGVSFRNDGRLLVVGGEEGRIRVFDEQSKALMKQFYGHNGAVRVSRFTPDRVFVMSAGDDKTVRKWDLGTEQLLWKTSLHTDSVRSGFVLESTPDVWVTGGYDKFVYGLDGRTQQQTFAVSLADPVEQMLSYGGDSNLAVANGNRVCIYDFRAFDRGPLVTLANHAKTVTCLATSDSETRLLTGSVDQSVKVWNLVAGSFECVLTQRFTAPVLSVGMAPSNQFFVVGMSDGLISMQHRPPPKTLAPEVEEDLYKNTRGHGVHHKPERGDFRVPTGVRIKRTKVDGFLRKFQYREALDASLSEKEPAGLTIALISDLIDRRALDASLTGRDDESLGAICDFLYAQITKSYYAEICIDVLDRILELYSSVFSQSKMLSEKFRRIQRKLDEEINLQKRYIELAAQLETTQTSSRK